MGYSGAVNGTMHTMRFHGSMMGGMMAGRAVPFRM